MGGASSPHFLRSTRSFSHSTVTRSAAVRKCISSLDRAGASYGVLARGSGLYTAAGRALPTVLERGLRFAATRRVGRMSNPPVAPSVAASKHKSAYVETSFKGTAKDANNA